MQGQDTRVVAVLQSQLECLLRSNDRLACEIEAKLPQGEYVLPTNVVGHSVLGTQLVGRQMVQKAPAGAEDLAFVDPAGLHYIRNGPQGAGGAAGAIYSYLGLNRETSFPSSVKTAIRMETDAKYHKYANQNAFIHCIHVVGPDLRDPSYTIGEAAAKLTAAYRNVLIEFASTPLHTLRLLPISGGIFSGQFMRYLPKLTAHALQAAFAGLRPGTRKKLSERQVLMCIFMGNELDDFVSAFKQR
jgi:hypothetical protein